MQNKKKKQAKLFTFDAFSIVSSRKSENPISCGGNDGTRSTNYYSCKARFVRFSRKHHIGTQILYTVQTVRRTIDKTSAL